MVVERNVTAIRLIIFFYHLLLTGMLAFPGGSAEDPITIAKTLIQDQEYSQAIEVLVDVIRTNPDRIEEAEALMAEIRTIRGSYNQLAADLIDTLENDPDNLEKAVALIDQMYSLDSAPNERTRMQLEEARRTAKLQLDRTLRDQRLARAREFIAEQEYQRAFGEYIQGFELQREEFLNASYDPELYSQVERLITLLSTIAQETTQRIDRWRAAVGDYQEVINQARQASAVGFSGMQGPLWGAGTSQRERLQEIVREDYTFITQGNEVLETLEALQTSTPGIVDYLVFLEVFTRGPQGSTQEGIAGLSRGLWNSVWVQLYTGLGEVVRMEQERFFGLLDSGQFTQAVHQGWKAQEFIAAASHAYSLAEGAPLQSLQEITQPWETRLLDQYAILYRTIQTSIAIAEIEVQLSQVVQASPYGLTQGVQGLEEQDQMIQNLAVLEQSFIQRVEAVRSAEAQAVSFQERVSTHVASLSERIRTSQSRILNQIALDLEQEAQALVQQAQDLQDEGQALVEGIPAEDQELLLRYPDQGLQRYSLSRSLLAEARSLVLRNEQTLEQFPGISVSLGNRRQGIEELNTRIVSQQQRLNELTQQAEENIRLAAEYRREGDQLVAQSTQAAQNLNVEQARDYFEEARISYFQSLELRNDEEFRQESDELILQLGDQIREAQNQIVVRQVRTLLEQAQSQYIAGEFSQALEIISRAEDTWSLTNTTTNPEINLLKNRITAATSLAQERELTEVDPLYATVSPFLNLARVDIEEGRRLVNQGNNNQGRTLITRAEENIENVLSIKPYNFEARIMQIQISQILAGDEFQSLFANRYRETVSRIGSAPDIDVYTDLQVLGEINPNYPGLQANIRELEIRLGLRENPITREAINESNRLLTRAQGLTNTADSAQLQAALDLLEQAIQVNPNNAEAKLLADTIRIRLGGQASLALSSADEQRFRRAENLFIQNNIAEAYAIVLQLLQDQQNQGYPPLLSLRDRIERRL